MSYSHGGRVTSVPELPFNGFQGLEGPWKGFEVHPPVLLEADLPKTAQTGNVTTSDAGELAKGKCVHVAYLNFFCCRLKVYFA